MPKLLIVEDDALMARVYVDKFRSAGFTVDLAMDGPTAMRRAAAAPPDLVLLDLVLGEANGVDVLAFIRSTPPLARIPVLVLSNAFLGALVDAAWKAGASKCLSKSTCSPNKLVDEVRALLPAPATTSAPTPAPAPTPPPATSDSERVRENLRIELVETLRTRITDARRHVHDWAREGLTTTSTAPRSLLAAVRALAGGAGLVGLPHLGHLAAATEGLLREPLARPGSITTSALRTATQAVDLFPALFRDGEDTGPDLALGPHVLVVDDDPIGREAIAAALNRAQLPSVRLGDATLALALIEENPFDLAILDIELPGLSGLEICDRLHATEANFATPVIIVSSHTDLQTRSQSGDRGAVDFIPKPIVLSELALKALVHLHRARLQQTAAAR